MKHGVKRSKPPLLGTLAAVALLVVLACDACKDKNPILVGFVAGTSGRVAELGISGRDAAQSLSGKDDYFFRVSPTAIEYATKSARYQIDRAGARRIAALYDRGNRTFCEN